MGRETRQRQGGRRRLTSARAASPRAIAADVVPEIHEVQSIPSPDGTDADRPALTSASFTRASATTQPPTVFCPSQNGWPGRMYVAGNGFAYGYKRSEEHTSELQSPM